MISQHNYEHVASRLKERYHLSLSVNEYIIMIKEIEARWPELEILLHHQHDQYVIKFPYKGEDLLMIYDARWRRVRSIISDDHVYEGEFEGWLGKGIIWPPRLLLTATGFTTPPLREIFLNQLYWHQEIVPVEIAYLGPNAKTALEVFPSDHKQLVTIHDLASTNHVTDCLRDCSVLWVDSGSMFYYMDFFIKHRIFGALEDFLLQGGIYVGVGGGSLVANYKLLPNGENISLDDPLAEFVKTRKGLALLEKSFLYIHSGPKDSEPANLKQQLNLSRKLFILHDHELLLSDGRKNNQIFTSELSNSS